MPNLSAHHRGSFPGRARAVRDRANADPLTLCWRCGRPAVAGDPWQAGHVVDGEVGGQLLPEHASCNQSAGARLGNQLRAARRSRVW